MAITDIKPGSYGKVFKRLARISVHDATKAQDSAEGLWPGVGAQGVTPASMGCDDDLITLGLAKDEGGVVYMKFDLSGWDE